MKTVRTLLAVLLIGISAQSTLAASEPATETVSAEQAAVVFQQILLSKPANTTAQIFIDSIKSAQNSGVTLLKHQTGSHQKINGSDYYTLEFDLLPGYVPHHLPVTDVSIEPLSVKAEIMILQGRVYVFSYSVERLLVLNPMMPGVSMGNN